MFSYELPTCVSELLSKLHFKLSKNTINRFPFSEHCSKTRGGVWKEEEFAVQWAQLQIHP